MSQPRYNLLYRYPESLLLPTTAEAGIGNVIFSPRAHGMLTGSFISTVVGMQLPGPGSIYAAQELSFRAPVFFGDTVTAKVECNEKLEPRKWLKFRTTVTNQDGKLVIDGTATVIPPSA